jgi:hypothetical protein
LIATDEYAAFLQSKAPRAQSTGFEPDVMPSHLFDFQAHCVGFAIRQGRAALFLDTGLGKTACELEIARQCAAASNGYALILTPLAVARQIEAEGHKWGYDCRVIRDQSHVRTGINICNYDRLDKLEPGAFGCVVLDESSILKSFNGATTRALIQWFSGTPYRFAATATPAPNDHMELGQHAEFLGVMPSNEMLMRWFVADQTEMGRYRLKRHGENDFWDWMASWSRCAGSPDDLGFDGSRFVLPELKTIRHKVAGDTRAAAGELFAADVSATNMFAVKRQTAEARAQSVADLVAQERDHDWLIWCDTDVEADALLACIGGAVEVRGSHSIEKKEAALMGFARGKFNVLVTKPSIASQGLNYQHCARMAFVGRSFSYEAWYQAVRRCWRFGQARPVHVHIMVAEGEDQIGRVIDRKAGSHEEMKRAMAAAMARSRVGACLVKKAYNPTHIARMPSWLVSAL